MSYADVELEIIRWAENRKIIPYAKPHTQLMKAVSEMGELCDAELKGDMDGIKDGVADVVICLINYCALKDINLVSCLELGYSDIKNRKGFMTPDGTFIKQE